MVEICNQVEVSFDCEFKYPVQIINCNMVAEFISPFFYWPVFSLIGNETIIYGGSIQSVTCDWLVLAVTFYVFTYKWSKVAS